MKVLTVVYDLGFGGTQRAAVNFAIALKEHNVESAIFVYKALGPREKELLRAGVQVFSKLNEALNWNPEIVHIFRWGHADLETANILREFKKTCAAKVVETNVFSFADTSLDRHLIDLHLHMTPWCLWKWSQIVYKLKDQSPGCVFPFVVNAKPFYPCSSSEKIEFRQKYKIPQDAFLLGRVGQPSMGKWHKVMLDEFYKIIKNYPNAYLLVVGLPDELKKYVHGDRVIQIDFLNSDEELRSCYSVMDAFFHISALGESFGMVLAEAMLCEVPVITLSTPRADNSQVYLVEHQKSGLIAKNITALTDAIEMLIKNKAFRDSLAKQARNNVINNYTSKSVVPQVLKIFSILLNSNNIEDLKLNLNKQGVATSIKRMEIVNKHKKSMGRSSFKDLFYIYFPKLYYFIRG
ncbi:MAG: glycosyltransferase family 4 protein [Oligoflexia bacterium]|nr:glycosyltransferase family 4 protein [Oligoflexia bacterium]